MPDPDSPIVSVRATRATGSLDVNFMLGVRMEDATVAPSPVFWTAQHLPQLLSPHDADGRSLSTHDIRATSPTSPRHHRQSVSSPDYHEWGPTSRPASRTSGRRAGSPLPDRSASSSPIIIRSSTSSSEDRRSMSTSADGPPMQAYSTTNINGASGAVPPPYDVSHRASCVSFDDGRPSWQELSRPGSPCKIELVVPSPPEPCSRSSSAAPDKASGKARGAMPAHETAVCEDTLRAQNIYPVCTTHVAYPRYYDTGKVSRNAPPMEKIQPVTLSFLQNGSYPSGWNDVLHPEGNVYFVHEKKPIYTTTDLFDPEKFKRIERFVEIIEAYKDMHSAWEIAKDAELVLILSKGGDECYYYMVDHAHRTLFWLNPFDPNEMISEVTTTNPAHIRHEFEYHYWTHWELFPHERQVTRALQEELTGVLMHASYDALSSNTSTAPYNHADLRSMTKDVKTMDRAGRRGGYAACVYGRMMGTFAHERFLNFASTQSARLNRDQAVYEELRTNRSYLVTILSPALFFAPDVHLKTLEKIWIDEMINEVPWKKFIQKLEDEWQGLILYATVLLSSNTALLAVPSADISVGTSRNPVQILCYVSTIASVASIILGLLLCRQYRTKARDTAADAARHLNKHTHPTRGLETLAILYSLPYAGLMWGMVSFLAAFASLCFWDTTNATRIPIGCVLGFVGALIVWCIVTGWEFEEQSWWTTTFSITWSNRDTATENGQEADSRPTTSLFSFWPFPFWRARAPKTAAAV